MCKSVRMFVRSSVRPVYLHLNTTKSEDGWWLCFRGQGGGRYKIKIIKITTTNNKPCSGTRSTLAYRIPDSVGWMLWMHSWPGQNGQAGWPAGWGYYSQLADLMLLLLWKSFTDTCVSFSSFDTIYTWLHSTSGMCRHSVRRRPPLGCDSHDRSTSDHSHQRLLMYRCIGAHGYPECPSVNSFRRTRVKVPDRQYPWCLGVYDRDCGVSEQRNI